MRKWIWAAVACFFSWPGQSQVLEVLPRVELDPAVPTLQQVLGYPWGEEISDPQQMTQYAEALAQAASQRVRLVPYATSVEGRPLFLLLLGKDAYLSQLDELAQRLRDWADPRKGKAGLDGRSFQELPAVVWLVGSVHGDEASGGEAALALAYYLAAGRSPALDQLLEKVLVVLDPMQNPDGRARFVASTRQARGRYLGLEPQDAEHVQPWPGGRFSHWLFDLNRDWFALTHPETQGRVARMLWLPPQVVVDLHEMGSQQGYFFPPPAEPHNPLVSPKQQELWRLWGRGLAQAFDGAGIRFWTREIFDAFYPGYGQSWPFFSGASGATFEQASTRGRAVRLANGEILRYQDAVAHHLLAAFTTLQLVATHKEAFQESFLQYRKEAVDEGKGKAYLWKQKEEAAVPLANLLAKQGLEVYRVDQGPLAGSFLLPQAQPLGRLAKVLLARDVPLPNAFAERQKAREAKGLPHEIYDVTAWSLPLLWGLEVEERAVEVPRQATLWQPGEQVFGGLVGEGNVAFVLPWRGLSSAQALVRLLQGGVKAGAAETSFTVGGQAFPRGSIVIPQRSNGDNLASLLRQVAAEMGVQFFATPTSLSDSGLDLGSPRVRLLALPNVALLWDVPTSPTAAGHLRFALEQELDLPVTALRGTSLGAVDLRRFQVLVLPDSFSSRAYAQTLGPEGVERLKNWVKEGGVLVAEGNAAVFLTEEKVGLLASKLAKRAPDKGKVEKAAKEKGYSEEGAEEQEEPPVVPGALLRVKLDGDELLTAGFAQEELCALVNSRRAFTPLPRGAGRNLAVFAKEKLLAAGFLFDQSKELLPGKAYFMMQRQGRGLVLAFAEPPAFRGMTRGTTQLLANAVLLGPALAGWR